MWRASLALYIFLLLGTFSFGSGLVLERRGAREWRGTARRRLLSAQGDDDGAHLGSLALSFESSRDSGKFTLGFI